MDWQDSVRFCEHKGELRDHYENCGQKLSRVWRETRDCTVRVRHVEDAHDLYKLMKEQIGSVKCCIVVPETDEGFVEFDDVQAADEVSSAHYLLPWYCHAIPRPCVCRHDLYRRS